MSKQLSIGTEEDGVLYIFEGRGDFILMCYENEHNGVDEDFRINVDEANKIIKFLQELVK